MAESEHPGEARVDGPVEDPTDAEPLAFDAFNATTWNFEGDSLPWYQTRRSVLTMVAVSVAMIALVVSLALLACR